jgi:hypothetical protein
VLSEGAAGGFYRVGEGAHAPGNGEEWTAAWWPAVSALKARGGWEARVGRGGEAARLLMEAGAARWGS